MLHFIQHDKLYFLNPLSGEAEERVVQRSADGVFILILIENELRHHFPHQRVTKTMLPGFNPAGVSFFE
ncbi:MAG: hypothetical protein JWR38_3101 [Mucilaginibacter sp.]|nr:hypothetical protein [Mucilaginibacter sp.]